MLRLKTTNRGVTREKERIKKRTQDPQQDQGKKKKKTRGSVGCGQECDNLHNDQDATDQRTGKAGVGKTVVGMEDQEGAANEIRRCKSLGSSDYD